MIGLIVLGLLWGELSADIHSLRYVITGLTPVNSFPEFLIVGYVDGIQFVKYDSDQKKLIPREQWMVESEGPEAWKRKLFLAREQELAFKHVIHNLKVKTNQTDGVHTHQMMTGCDLRNDETVSGFNQYGWDGRDYISFDKDLMVWVTPVPWAESIKNSWDQDVVDNQRWKHYLEVECIEWLRKYLEYGQRELTMVAPIVSFIRLSDSNRLSCLVTGFYPQAIEVTLRRDGMLIDETLSTGILPNHNGTYQIRKWVEFDPEDHAEYSCQVEHSGLEETLVVIYATEPEEYTSRDPVPKSHFQVLATVGIVFGVLGIISLSVVGIIFHKKKASDGKKSTATFARI